MKERIKFSVLKYVYKCLNGQGTEYLSELLEVYKPSRDF